MAETLSVVGEVQKLSSARSNWSIPLDVSEDIEVDAGASTLVVPANGSATLSLTHLTAADFLLLVTPRVLDVTLTLAAGTFSVVPVRGVFMIQTEGLTAVQMDNADGIDVLVTIEASRRVLETP